MHSRSNDKIKYEDEIKSMSHDDFKDYCLKVSKEIRDYCNKNKINYSDYFHHEEVMSNRENKKLGKNLIEGNAINN